MATIDPLRPDPGSLLDEKQFKSMSDALGEDFAGIVDDYFESCVSFGNRLDAAVDHDDVGQFRNICHEIKGASGLIGFRGIASTAAAWETAAAEGQLPDDAHLADTFARLVGETKTYVGLRVI